MNIFLNFTSNRLRILCAWRAGGTSAPLTTEFKRALKIMYRIVAIFPCAAQNKELTYLNYLLNYATIHATIIIINYHPIF